MALAGGDSDVLEPLIWINDSLPPRSKPLEGVQTWLQKHLGTCGRRRTEGRDLKRQPQEP